MFKTNERHRQHAIFAADSLLSAKYRKRLRESWSHAFRHEVFARIDETVFSVLYSEEASRPNAPVNFLVGADILKAGFGWSDRQLADELAFDLQVRHALGIDDLGEEVPEVRTLQNFRRRVREYAEESGVNLYEAVFAQVTDEQLDALEVKTEWQRTDSTQMLSNLAKMSRLELLIATVQKLWLALPEEAQARWEEQAAPYMGARPYQICYGIKRNEISGHLYEIGTLLATFLEKPDLFEGDDRRLLERILAEQFELTAAGDTVFVRVRENDEIEADSVQSPHDLEATYRKKNGKEHRGGYVVNLSETCSPENTLQLITDLQVAPNTTDDAELLEESLEAQAERDIEIDRMTTDGGYTGPVSEQACEKHQVELRATNMRGGKSRGATFGWEDYTWSFDNDGTPVQVTCPQGQHASINRGSAKNTYIARFAPVACQGCPFRASSDGAGGMCRVKPRRQGPTLYVKDRNIRTALQRQRLCPEDKPVRTLIESTNRSVKHPFPGGKLPVRGLIRAVMMICGSAIMTNLHRIHKEVYRTGLPDHLAEPHTRISARLSALRALLRLPKTLVQLIVDYIRKIRLHTFAAPSTRQFAADLSEAR